MINLPIWFAAILLALWLLDRAMTLVVWYRQRAARKAAQGFLDAMGRAMKAEADRDPILDNAPYVWSERGDA